MEKSLRSFSNYLRDLKKIYFAVLFLLSSSFGLAQTISTNKTVTANTADCGIVNVKLDITGSNPAARNSDVILVIDVSGSMGNTIRGDTKTSMDYAKLAAKSFISQASANTNNRIAIVSYTTNAKLELGLTYLNTGGVTALNAKIDALIATNNTNIQDGIVKAETELETNGRFDCATARSIILLTDGVTNRTGATGNTTSCNTTSTTSTCVKSAITAATNAKTTVKSSITYNNQIFSVGLFGGIPGNINTPGSDQFVAKFTLDGIQGSASYITQNAANLNSIYTQIATQISWVAQSLVQKETILPGFTIGAITATKGTASLSGQVITWNTDFLNSETITLNYQLTPTGSACGTQTVSTSTLNYQNSACVSDSKTIISPAYFVPCTPLISGVLTACGSTTLIVATNAASPTYVWYKDNVEITGQTASTLLATVSGVYKVKVKNGTTNCELTSIDSNVTISPDAALNAPANTTITGCGTDAITGLPYSIESTNITLAQLNTAGGSLSNNASIGTYTISYSDTITGTCPILVTRIFKVTASCGIVRANQTITIQDTTAPTWTTSANALNVTLQCSDAAGLNNSQNQAPVATDNCGGAVTYTKTSGIFTVGSCSNSGTYTNTWIAKDVCLNSSITFTQVITIEDTTAPTWTTSANALNVTLQCSDTAGLGAAQNQAPVATDNCGGTVTYTKTSGIFTVGSCDNSGTYTNTWIAKDVCLNTSTTFTQIISIEDTTAPTWTTSANALNVTLQCSDTAGLNTAQNQAPVATDNCDGTITYTKTSGTFAAGSCSNSGTYTNTWIAKDVCLNSSTTFTQVITIEDTIAPTWTTSANALNVTLQCSDTAGLNTAQNQAPVATDNCDGTITYTKTSGTFAAGSCSNSGTYTNTWIAKDGCLNTSTTFTQIITIEDTTAPTWTTSANALNVTLQCSDTSGLGTAQNQAPVATDNCGGTITYTKTSGVFAAGSCSNSGTYTNTWIAKDGCLNSSITFTQVITIEDTTAPTWTTSANALNITLQCSDTTGLATSQNQAPVATDNCGGTVTYTKTSGIFTVGSCSNSGTYTNTWIAKDVCLNSSITFKQVITIEDTTAPTWTTSANALNVTLQCSDTAGLGAAQNQAPVATDNCGGTVTYTKTSGTFAAGSCSNSGTYTNTWIAKDVCLNTSTTFTQIITIEDTTAPNWTTSANALNITLQCSDNAGLTTSQNQAPVATDNCGGSLTYTKTSGTFAAGSCSNSGTYTNSWIAKDVCLNTSTTFTQIITIEDTTAPTWTTSTNDLNVTLQCSDTAGLNNSQNQAPVATDNCGGAVTYTKTSGTFAAGSCSNSGTYTNTWIAKDVCLNTSTTFTQIITIEDTTAPTWTTSANALNVTLQCSDTAGLTTAQNHAPVANDNCGGTVTYTKTSGTFNAGSCSNSGKYTNTWIAKDVCLNTSTTFTQIITIEDTIAPTWTTSANALNVTLQCSDTTGLATSQNQAPVATDNCGGTVTYTKTSGIFTVGSCSNSGTYTNTWIAKDVCLNTSTTFTQIISIEDSIAPTWTTPTGTLNVTVQCSDTAGLATAQNQAAVATDNCGGTVTYTKTSGIFAAASCSNSGTYTNTWIAKDVCLNTSTTFTQIISIEDTTAPIWTTSANALNVTLQCSDTTGLNTAQNQAPVATDNCNGTVTYTKTSGVFAGGSCSNSGTYTNTWIAKDVCLNTSTTFTQIITIEDSIAPTWTTSANALNVTLQCSDVKSVATAQNQAPVATDNCGGTVNYTKTSGIFTAGSCSNSGTYTNTWIAKDVCLNTSTTFTQIISIEDTIAPTWTTPMGTLNVTVQCSDAEALVAAQAQFPIATDTCDGDVSNSVKTSGVFVPSETCSNAGTYTNTWIVKDDCGNTSDIFIQIITIEDTTKPLFSGDLPTNIIVSCDAVPEPAQLTVSDNCNLDLPIVFSEIKSDIQNQCNSNYTLTRTWTTSDCSGNTASYSQIITVRDTTAPTGTAPADVTGLQSIANIPVGNPQDLTNISDNCDSNVTVTINDSNNGANGCDGNAYILTRTYTLTDCSGNKTELVQTFTVENKVTVSAVVSNVTCLGGTDGQIIITSSHGSTVVIKNQNNEVVGNTNLPAGIYTLTATSAVNNENQTCTATTTVTITEPPHKIKISGQIINIDTNTPLANVPVTLIPQGTTTGPVLLRLTDANGMYSFTDMVSGNYVVQVQDANLISANQLYPVNSNSFLTTLEECKFQVHNFEYGKSTLPVLGDYVWYDTNANGIQDEWYDANNDGIITKNIPDGNGAIDYSLWEWIDLNGDGSYSGAQNVGELNAGGFGNAMSPNVIIDGPNGYHTEVIIGMQGFWTNRPAFENPYGNYNVKLLRDSSFDTAAAALGATGLVKVIPSATAKNAPSKTGKAQMHTICSITSPGAYIATVTPANLVHLDLDFGIVCKTYADIIANDDSAGPIAGVNIKTPNILNVLPNDTLEGVVVTAADVVITTVTPNEFLHLNPDGSVDLLPNAPTGTLTLVYQICEADDISNCDTAIVTVTVINTPPAPPTIQANDDVYATIGCSTFGLVGNVLSNDFLDTAGATIELTNFTLLTENNNAITTDPNISIDASGNVNVSGLTPAGTYTYTYQLCVKAFPAICDTATVTITVVPNGIIHITNEACAADSTLINLQTLLPENTPATGTWTDTGNSNALQGSIFNPFGLALGNYTFEYKITDENCPRSVVLTMEVNDDCKVLACASILIHNAFTPNGDGKNDFFQIDNIDEVTCYPENTVEIYNRWGILVFETINYNNTTNAFDGTSRGRTTIKQSEGLPTGTYFYIINYDTLDGNNLVQNHKESGYIYLSK